MTLIRQILLSAMRGLLPVLCFLAGPACSDHQDAGNHPAAVPLARPPSAADDFTQPGRHAVHVTTGSLVIDGGRPLAYSLFEPERAASDTVVILAHGFMRDRKRMAGWARHFASWGFTVATPDFRQSRPWAGNHAGNARDLIALAGSLGRKRTLYAGFSAGALSALLAAADDPSAVGYLGFDPVDDGSGSAAATRMDIPSHVLLATPSSCNAQGNGLAMFASSRHARVVLVEDATHCHFEFPMDGLCPVLCGRGEKRFSQQDIRKTILGLATGSLLMQTGGHPDAASWWEADGPRLNQLLRDGRVRLATPARSPTGTPVRPAPSTRGF